MDWKLIGSAFGMIFLAELGDKTQLATVTLTASSARPWSVLLGTSAALLAINALGVVAGSALSQVIPLDLVRKLGAVAFLVVGTAMLLDWI